MSNRQQNAVEATTFRLAELSCLRHGAITVIVLVEIIFSQICWRFEI